MSWPSVRLGEHLVKLGSGVTPRGGDSVYVPEGTALIRSQNVYNNRFHNNGLAYISAAQAEKMKGVTVNAGDILLNITGDSVARCCGVPEDVLPARVNQHVMIIRPCPGSFDPSYLIYQLTGPFFQSTLLSIAGSGGTRKALTKAMIERLEMPKPEIGEQRRIAAILSAYDDLIENNRRRIALLEEAARQLYKEWFVRFRFPGYEHVELVDGVPAGWERQAIGEVADDISYGYTASADANIDGPKFLRITDIVKGQISWPDVPRCPIDERKAARFALVPGDVVVARTGATTGWARRIGRVREPAVFASYLVRFRFTDLINPTLAAIFMESESYKAMVWAGIGGSAQPNASAQLLAKPKLLVPPQQLQEAFAREVGAGQLLIDVLMEQIHGLSRARDLLLPRLMNGAITV